MVEEKDECCDGQLTYNVWNVIKERSLNGGDCKEGMGKTGKEQSGQRKDLVLRSAAILSTCNSFHFTSCILLQFMT